MTYTRVASVFSIVSCFVVGAGCDFGRGFEGLGDAIDCIDFNYRQSIDGDLEQLEADVRCEDDADCADSRTVIKGSSFEFLIEVPADGRATAPSVTSDTERLEISGFDTETDPCDGNYQLVGTAHYIEVGPAALIIADDDGEIDRFTVTVHEPDHLTIQTLSSSSDGYVSYADGDTISIADTHIVKVSVRNADGERLVGAQNIGCEIEDTSIAICNESLLLPREIGATTLRMRGAGLTAELQLEVTAVPEDIDGGLGDAAMQQ